MEEKSFLGRSPLGFHRIAYTEWGHTSLIRRSSACMALPATAAISTILPGAWQSATRVFCPDIAGRGKSDDLGDPMHYNYPQYLADMTALIAPHGR